MRYVWLKHTGTKRMALGREFKLKLPFLVSDMSEARTAYFVVCLDNEGYEASLEVGKLYRATSDTAAASHGYVRVVDESGEDYAFLASRFYRVELPQAVERALLAAS